MKRSHAKQLHRLVACAVFAGTLAAPFAAPEAYALPSEGTNAAANAGEASITTSGAVMDIVGKTEHNVLNWEDFSVDSGETVKFDGGSQTRDYLNLVTGEGASNIYGTIEGGRNVYLVNPHGILFAEGSVVNTGALYLSTANPDAVKRMADTPWRGNNPLYADVQTGDILNLGTVKANTLYIEGRNVTVLNTNNVTDEHGTPLHGMVGGPGTKPKVRIYSEETPHIGYEVANTTKRDINVNGENRSYTVSNYAHPNSRRSASQRAWDVRKLNGGGDHAGYDYMLVHDVYELQNMDARMDSKHGRYMLARDIDARVTKDWNDGDGFSPIRTFTGHLDGVKHTVSWLTIRRGQGNGIGLFGHVQGSHIENLFLTDANVRGNTSVGGIVGQADNAVIRNVSYAGTVMAMQEVGGIVGWAKNNTTVQNAWNKGSVQGEYCVGGVVGKVSNSLIQHVCNTGAVSGHDTEDLLYIGGIAGQITDGTIQYAWNAGYIGRGAAVVALLEGGTIRHAVWDRGSAGAPFFVEAAVIEDVKWSTAEEMKQAATYKDWKDDKGNDVVSAAGGKRTPWRIYEGQATPLLTGLMQGTKSLKNVEKVYDGTVSDVAGIADIMWRAGKDVGTYHAYSEKYDIIGGVCEITPRDLTLTAEAASVTQGEPLPAFTGKATGFADGEDESVFGADGVTFTTAAADTNTPGSYAVIGKAGGIADGVLGNYRIVQAADNASAFIVNAPLTDGILAAPRAGGIRVALVQDAAPHFDFGFGDDVYRFGTPRSIRAATLGLYRFDAERDLEIQGIRL